MAAFDGGRSPALRAGEGEQGQGGAESGALMLSLSKHELVESPEAALAAKHELVESAAC